MVTQRDPNIAKRRIYFYRVDIGQGENGHRLPFDAQARLAPVAALSFANGSAYLDEDDRVTCGWLDRRQPRARLRVADIRRQDLPQLELGGALGPLAISQGAGLAEQVHVSFFDHNIVGSDFNFYGPRMGRVARYLQAKANVPFISFEHLIRRNIIDQLNQLRDIRLFQMRISPSYIDEIGRVDATVAAAFRSAMALGDSGRVEIVLRPVPYTRGHLSGRVRDALVALAGRRETLDAADVFKTSGLDRDGRIRTLDLLNDELVVEREVRRLGDGSRALDPESVYGAIETAYATLRPELETAAGGSAQ